MLHDAARAASSGDGSMITAAIADGFSLVTRQDDAEVRALLRRCVMPGAVQVAFTREPDYFAGEGLAGAIDHTIVHRREGRLDGVARLSVHSLNRHGSPAAIGYLGELRIAPNAPHSAQMLRDGYAQLREVMAAEQVSAAFTSIASDNQRARRVLEHGPRFGLPRYTPLADLVTLLIPVRHSARRASGSVAHGQRTMPGAAGAVDVEELTAFLAAQSQQAQLTLTWDHARWRQLAAHGVTPDSFCVVRANGTSGPIVAAGAVWDQRAFKQTVVMGYDGALRVSRPLVNTLALTGVVPSLPAPFAVLSQGAILGLSVAADAPSSTWTSLLEALCADAARHDLSWLVVSRETRDPQLPRLRETASAVARVAAALPTGVREYHTRLYDVRWADGVASASRRTAGPDASAEQDMDDAGASPRLDEWSSATFRPEVALL